MSEQKKHINPSYNRYACKTYSLEECIAGISTDRQILSWLISKAESQDVAAVSFINRVLEALPIVQETRRIAVSGSPGVGKSTFLNSYGRHLIDQGRKIAILPVDPTSYLSHGSILGDKTRMEDLVGLQAAFIKPMASALALGGVAPSTHAAIALCERAGFHDIFIETVGVGQSEYEVRHLVDMFLLLLQPGGGDDLQGIKRGIMEMADLVVVTKSDGDLLAASEQSAKWCKQALRMMLANDFDWSPAVVNYSSVNHNHKEALDAEVSKYFSHMEAENRLQTLRQEQMTQYFRDRIDDVILEATKAQGRINSTIVELSQKVKQGTIMPSKAIEIFRTEIDNEDS